MKKKAQLVANSHNAAAWIIIVNIEGIILLTHQVPLTKTVSTVYADFSDKHFNK